MQGVSRLDQPWKQQPWKRGEGEDKALRQTVVVDAVMLLLHPNAHQAWQWAVRKWDWRLGVGRDHTGVACLPAASFHFSVSPFFGFCLSPNPSQPERCTSLHRHTERERGRLGSGQLNSTQFIIACVPHQSICPSHPANLPRPDWPLTVSRFSLILSFALHPSNAVTATHSGLASNSTNSASIQHPQHLAYAVMHDYLARPDVNRFQCIHRHLQRWINSLPGPMLIAYIQ